MRFNICCQCNGDSKRKKKQNVDHNLAGRISTIGSLVTEQPKSIEPPISVDSAPMEQRLSVLERDAIAQLLQAIEESEKSNTDEIDGDEIDDDDNDGSEILTPTAIYYEDPMSYEELDKHEDLPVECLDEYVVSKDENGHYYHHHRDGQSLKHNHPISRVGENSLFEAECLKWHNEYRSLHGVQPLAHSEYLCQIAREWAGHMALTKTFDHRPNNEYGENLYRGDIMHASAKQIVTDWYNQISAYDFDNPSYSTKTEHFVKLLWKESREMGTGVARLGDEIWVCCYYHPQGNYDKNTNEEFVPRPVTGSATKLY